MEIVSGIPSHGPGRYNELSTIGRRLGSSNPGLRRPWLGRSWWFLTAGLSRRSDWSPGDRRDLEPSLTRDHRHHTPRQMAADGRSVARTKLALVR